MRINNNMMAMNTHRQLGVANNDGAKSMEKLSSGFRINRAGDDAAGLAISEKMRGQIRGLNQASSNAQDGISLIQTAEGALNETHAILQRMRELAVQSSTDTNTDDDRLEIQKEVDQLSEEITRIAETTQFNTMELLDGTYDDMKFHIGANATQSTTIKIADMKSDALGVSNISYTGTATVGSLVNAGNIVADGTAIDTASYKGPNGTIKMEIGKDFKATTKTVITAAETGTASGTTNVTAEAFMKADTITVTATGGTAFANLGIVSAAGDAWTLTDNSDGTITATSDVGDDTFTFDLAGIQSDGETIIMTATSASETVYNGTVKVTNANGSTENVKLEDVADGKFTTKSGIKVTLEAGLSASNVGNSIEFEVSGMTAVIAEGGIRVNTQEDADAAITTINTAITTVSAERSKLGAMQNRLEHTIKNLDTSAENLQASEARIRDVDMAKEMMEQTKQNILAQASTAMLAQANAAPQTVLSLLR